MPVHQNLPHESAWLHVTGTAKYTADLPEPRELLYAWPVMSPHTHAEVLSIDFAAALERPGVVHILTAADVTGQNNTGPVRHDEPLFPHEVMYHSQAVAWVLAESEQVAQAATHLVQVEYRVLPAIVGIRAALEQNSFHNPQPLKIVRSGVYGGVDLALEQAECSLEGELELGGQDHFYLETHASQAMLDEDGAMMVQCSTQHPSETQTIVAEVLGWSRNRVAVQCLRMGGGFGGKETQANAFAAIAALGAVKTGRPVRVRLTRHLDMLLTGKRHPFLARYRVGFSKTGQLEALKVDLFGDAGWSLDLSEAIVSRAMFHIDNCYFVPALEVAGYICKTNVTSHTAFRGFGGPQGMLVIEEILGQVSRALKLRPEQVRQQNFYQVNHSTHYGQPLDEVRIGRIWNELLESSDFVARQKLLEGFNGSHPFFRRGIAITPVKFGISFTTTFLNQAGALVLIYADGSVQVNHGGTEMGQGLHTKMQQVAAHTLGISTQNVRIMPTRTDKVPNTSATAASSGTDLNGMAVQNACATLLERLSEVAARMFGQMFGASVHPQDIRFAGDLVGALGRLETFSWQQVVSQAYLSRVSLSSTGYFRTPEIHYDKVLGRGNPFRYFAWGAAVSEVQLDILTGMWTLERVDILHDCGNSLNPMLDVGQLEGGFVQGMGWLTMEELVWDDSGKLKTFAPSTYKIPTLAEIPTDFRVNLLTHAFEPKVILGSKAVGEPPLMLAISVREALRDALSSLGNGAVHFASPATPERLFWAAEGVKNPEKERALEGITAD